MIQKVEGISGIPKLFQPITVGQIASSSSNAVTCRQQQSSRGSHNKQEDLEKILLLFPSRSRVATAPSRSPTAAGGDRGNRGCLALLSADSLPIFSLVSLPALSHCFGQGSCLGGDLLIYKPCRVEMQTEHSLKVKWLSCTHLTYIARENGEWQVL